MECVRSGIPGSRGSGKSFASATPCGKASSRNLIGSTKFEQNLHGKVKTLQLSASGTSGLIHRGPVLKQQRGLAVRSTSADVCTTFDENVNGVSSHAVEEKVGVLLLNLGGPETLSDVQPFLFNLFADPGGLDLFASEWNGQMGLSPYSLSI